MALSTDDLDGDRSVWTFRVSRWDPETISFHPFSDALLTTLRVLTPRVRVPDRTDPNERRLLELADEDYINE
jgi:hypothetical protein